LKRREKKIKSNLLKHWFHQITKIHCSQTLKQRVFYLLEWQKHQVLLHLRGRALKKPEKKKKKEWGIEERNNKKKARRKKIFLAWCSSSVRTASPCPSDGCRRKVEERNEKKKEKKPVSFFCQRKKNEEQ
jgi:hypothetical protein